MPPIENPIGPLSLIRVSLAAFSLSFCAGVASHLREGKTWTVLSVFVAGMCSGCLGLALLLLWYQRFQDNIQFLMGVCILAGLSGRPMVDAVTTDFVALIKRRLGITTLEVPPHDSDPKK